MQEGYFKEKDLKKYDAQYMIRHHDVECFVYGQKVFLKSNPECPMRVYLINKTTVSTIWHTKTNKIEICEFPPECILQYEYAGLITYREKFNISLN